jgi:hypothetical protein
LGNDRRHSRAYETLTVNSEAMIQISMIRLLLKRLAWILKQLLIIGLFVGNILYPKQSSAIKTSSDKPIIPDDFRKKIHDDVKNFITVCTLKNVPITRAMRIILKNYHISSDINIYIKDYIGEILDKEEQLKEAKELEDETKQTELRAWFRQQLYSLDEKFNV